MKKLLAAITVAGFATVSTAAIDISVDTQKGIKKISPYLYGRNIDKISDGDPEVNEEETAFINQMLEAGVHMLRANNGNNATRYNWRHKMTVHPDWYNNVYSHDWAITAQKVLDKMPGIDAMYAFQLTGFAASSTEYNFADWNWYQEHGSYPSQADIRPRGRRRSFRRWRNTHQGGRRLALQHGMARRLHRRHHPVLA